MLAHSRGLVHLPSLVLATCVAVAAASAQCTPQLQANGGYAGADGAVRASLAYDPDGPGPLSPRLVIGGEFHAAGTVAANGIAAWDEVANTWSAFGTGINGRVQALAVMPNGDLIAAGVFSSAGGVAANSIARWNGSVWSPLGSGVSGAGLGVGVNALAVLPNGDLIAGGSFLTAGGATCYNLARWDGSAWTPLGGGALGTVRALVVRSTGELVVAGDFAGLDVSIVGGVPTPAVLVTCIASWNGSTWSGVGGSGAGSFPNVSSLLALPNGDIVAGGAFTVIGGTPADRIARWNGTTWSPLGSGITSTIGFYAPVQALASLPNGDLVAGVDVFVSGSTFPMPTLHRWNGTAWSTLGGGITSTYEPESGVCALATLANGDLAIGGRFALAGGVVAANLARWNGTALAAFVAGTNGGVNALAALPDGSVVAGGTFTTIGGVAAEHLARWNGAAWSPVGGGVNDLVDSLAVASNGDLFAGGKFWAAGGVLASMVARWDGASWSPLGTGVASEVRAMIVTTAGDLVIGGSFGGAGGQVAHCVARWNGAAWSAIGVNSFANYGSTNALVELPNGDLVAAGQFTNPGGAPATLVTRWDGVNWTPLLTASYSNTIRALAVLPNGTLVAGGQLAPDNIRQWNGAVWTSLGTGVDGPVKALTVLPNGDLVAGGDFGNAGGVPAQHFARWNGTSWSPFVLGFDGTVAALAFRADGALWAGGAFQLAGGQASTAVARLVTPCPATAALFGSGCSGAAGPNVLAPVMLPWLGATSRSLATGMLGSTFVLGIYGLGTTTVPLASVFAPAAPGCTWSVTPDLLEVSLPIGDTATMQIAIPQTAALVGFVVHEQAMPFTFDTSGNLTAVTSSNALSLTLGVF